MNFPILLLLHYNKDFNAEDAEYTEGFLLYNIHMFYYDLLNYVTALFNK
jgi:hypothetical protein